MNVKTILVTSDAGYIGHTIIDVIESGYKVVSVDNYSHNDPSRYSLIEKISGTKPAFYDVDIRDKSSLKTVVDQHNIDSVIHFSSLKAVDESVEKPIGYY